MAEIKTLNTRIKLRIDTLENWNNSTLTLLPGEIAFASVAASAGNGLEEPVIMAKIATEEGKTFKELPWAFHAKASDVLAACKTEAGLTKFIKDVLTAEGVASDSVLQELVGRVDTAEDEIDALQAELDTAETGLKARIASAEAAIDALEELTGGKEVSAAINDAIEALNLATTYAAKSVETTVANHIADTVAHVTADDKIAWNNALQSANITTGSANGTIAVKGNDVAVKGLGSAAFTEASAYDAAGSATAAQSAAETYAKNYADGLAKNYDAAGSAAAAQAAAEKTAKDYTDEREIAIKAAYEAYADQAEADAKAYTDTFTAGKTVAESISDAIASYSTTAQMEAAIATAKGEATQYADGLNTAMDARVQAVEGKAHEHSFVESELNKISDGDVAKWNAAEQNAKDYADAEDAKIEARVLVLEGKFTGEDSVADQIADAVAGETAAREEAIAGLQGQIGVASAEGVTATGLHAKIEAVDAELARLTGGNVVSEAIEAAVKTERERAQGIEGGLETRLAAVEADYLTSTDKEALQTQINTIMSNPDAEGAINSINEFTQYVKDHGTIADGMRTDINKNKDDIAAEADRAVKAEAALQGEVDALEGRMDAAEGAIATKAAQADLETLAGRVTTAEGKITTLEGEMDSAEGRLDALEDLTGGKNVADAIDEAVEAAKADASTKDAVVLAEAQKNIAAHAEDADIHVTAEKQATWNAAVQNVTAAADSGLKATRTGNDVAIEIDDSIVFIFDCGGASDPNEPQPPVAS